MLSVEVALLAALGITLALGVSIGMAAEKTRRRLYEERWSLVEGAARLAERRHLIETEEPWRVIHPGTLRVGPNRRVTQ